MPETINWSFSVGAVDGPRVSGSDAFEVDAYDKVSVVLPAAADVPVQPATDAGKVHLLVIRASAYDAAIEVSVDDTSTNPTVTTTFSLDGPLVLIGSGAVKLLLDSSSAPHTLKFTNGTGADVTVDILVGRDATP